MLGTGHLNGPFDQAQSLHSVCGSWPGAGCDHSAQLGNQQPMECVSHHQLWPSWLQVTLHSRSSHDMSHWHMTLYSKHMMHLTLHSKHTHCKLYCGVLGCYVLPAQHVYAQHVLRNISYSSVPSAFLCLVQMRLHPSLLPLILLFHCCNFICLVTCKSTKAPGLLFYRNAIILVLSNGFSIGCIVAVLLHLILPFDAVDNVDADSASKMANHVNPREAEDLTHQKVCYSTLLVFSICPALP